MEEDKEEKEKEIKEGWKERREEETEATKRDGSWSRGGEVDCREEDEKKRRNWRWKKIRRRKGKR